MAAILNEQAYIDRVLDRLGKLLVQLHSTAGRCWKEPALKQAISQVQSDLAREGTEATQSAKFFLDKMLALGIATKLPVDGQPFYWVEFGAGVNAQVDPLELLMAARPEGVACYFSALGFHSLTTQPVAHHHVAELTAPSENSPKINAKTPPAKPAEAPSTSVERAPRSLGTLLFHYQQIPYYVTRRSSRLVPGVQVRNHGPRTRIRITTVEQTLLDALYKPYQCGGPEVVFEAWREGTASGTLDEERFVQYLGSMNYPATARRLGAILEQVGYEPGRELGSLLNRTREEIDRNSPFASISLLPGVGYVNLNEQWLVKTP